jgi:ABC-type branched-subunit amino acid transport system substrate-binding protein
MEAKNMGRRWVAALLVAACWGTGHAQILIGQTAGFTGPAAAGVKETTDGARLWLDAVNARGGIGG